MDVATSNKTIITIFKNIDEEGLSVTELQLNDSDILICNNLNNKPKADFLAGRISIRESIKQYFLLKNKTFNLSNLEISYDLMRKPFVKGEEGTTISISHSSGWGAGIISSYTDIGIDIEKIKKRDHSIIDYILSDKEQRLFVNNMSVKMITVLWTMKESIMKACGKGLFHPHFIALNNFLLYDNGYIANFIDQDKKKWQVRTVLIDDYVVSVAYVKENYESIILSWNIKIGLQTTKKLPVS